MIKNKLRRHLEETIPEADLRLWFDPLELSVDPDDAAVTVVFPHPFFAQWFDTRIKDRFERQAGLFLGTGSALRYRCKVDEAGADPSALPAQAVNVDFPFGHEFTFEQFFTNHKNLFPLATAKEIAKSREPKFNPFIIQGQPGTGKSHLMRCMANEMSKLMEKSDIFVGDVDELSSLAEPSALRSALSGCRCFFLDDLHRSDRHPELIRELLSLFNAFQGAGALMVFTATAPVSTFAWLSDELRTRLDSGLMVQLAPPDLDVRMKYIQEHCQRKKLQLSKSQMLTLAQIHRDFRSLLGVLNKFQAFREVLKRDISEAIFENILGRSHKAQTGVATPDAILALVAQHFKVDKRDLLGPKRRKELVLARQVAMLLCREELGLSYPALGKLFGGKDHSTVLYGVKKIHQLQNDSTDMKNLVNSLRKGCRQTPP